MSNEALIPPELLQAMRVRARSRIGRCYELAWKGIMRCPEATLVHGIVRGPCDSRIEHAWLMVDDSVYDVTDDRVFSWQEYRDRFAAVVTSRYSLREAARNAADSGHSGPWLG